jgi:hypothetical protein
MSIELEDGKLNTPKRAPNAMPGLSEFSAAKDEKMSGAPFPKARKVTP